MNNTKKIISILMAAAVFAASASAFAAEDVSVTPSSGGGGKEYKTATVTIDAQKDGEFLIVPQTITVSSNKADEYGFPDSDDGVTMLDALVTLHEMYYGAEFTPKTVGRYLTTGYNADYDYYYISTSFEVEAPNGGYSASGYFINNEMVSLTAEKALINNGDSVEYAFYNDTEMYMDCYTAFVPNKVSTTAGTPVELPMFMIDMPMWYPDNELESISDEYDFEAMTINLVNEDGSISEALTDEYDDLIVPDENGIVTLTFDEPGTYIVTASGFIGEDYPIIAPYCIVTVTEYALENITIKASATVKKAENAQDAIVVLAVYDKNGVLTGTETKTAESGDIDLETTIPNGSFVKLFIWDSIEGMKPLAPID